jgi:hypothetical protein
MGSANSKAKAAARRAHIEQLRKAEQARDRRHRFITIIASTVILAGLGGGGWYLLSAAQDKEKAEAAPVKGEQTWSKLGRNHVAKDVDYPMSPAAGGDHNAVWVSCDAKVYTKELQEENAVHSLEHGAVWVTYNDEASKDDVDTLSEKVSATQYSFLSPHRNQSSPIVLTAWGHQLKVDKASDPRVATFMSKYVQGSQTPEPGASCSGGTGA